MKRIVFRLIGHDDGAALISVLLLVSVMSAAMVASFDLLGFYTRNVVIDNDLSQAREYALAGEIVGAKQALNLSENREIAQIAGVSTDMNRITIPVENGTVTGTLREASNCFNLNSVVKMNNADQFELNQIGHEQFTRLLINLGVGNRAAASLSDALVDWQDSDGRPMPSGAEDYTYSLNDIPHHSANAPLVDVNELRLINGFTPELIDAIKPFVCVDPFTLKTAINLNSINAHQAIIAQSLLGSSLSTADIATILQDRPEFGYDHVTRFWDHSFLRGKNIHSDIRSQFSLRSNKYEVTVDVSLANARVHLVSNVLLRDDGTYQLINRKYGAS